MKHMLPNVKLSANFDGAKGSMGRNTKMERRMSPTPASSITTNA
jgi:hypothetical protein